MTDQAEPIEEQPTTEQPAESEPTEVLENGRRWRLRTGLAIGLVVLVAAGAGVGAYFIGKNSGEDLDAARADGAAAGQKAGAVRGAAIGYREGLKDGRKRGFKQTYPKAYRAAYAKAYDDAGLDPPANKDIKVAAP